MNTAINPTKILIPWDDIVISYDTAMQLSADNLDAITWEMPAPILVVEVVSPSIG